MNRKQIKKLSLDLVKKSPFDSVEKAIRLLSIEQLKMLCNAMEAGIPNQSTAVCSGCIWKKANSSRVPRQANSTKKSRTCDRCR